MAPDIFVVKGVPKGDRRTYKLWEEDDKGPQVVFEVSSRRTRKEDLGPKKGTYEMLEVREYFLFDPLGEYLEPPLVGYWLEEGGYRRVEGERLWLYDLETGEELLSPLEAQAAHRAEAAARREAEEEVARLRAELTPARFGGS
jgi:Uma2 family endonuclease